eukprot:GHVL01042513.1.p1 GENE.GHVL01042513.1~~GHVL01042513.1.p1  ORF type:complete len:117 (-),score=16.84 GHVL01042513.1:159-509(-)
MTSTERWVSITKLTFTLLHPCETISISTLKSQKTLTDSFNIFVLCAALPTTVTMDFPVWSETDENSDNSSMSLFKCTSPALTPSSVTEIDTSLVDIISTDIPYLSNILKVCERNPH